MKKANVLQLSIVLIGIVFGFVALQYIIGSLWGIFSWIFSGGYGNDAYYGATLTIVAAVGLQVICCWLLITKSAKITAFLYKKADLETGVKILSNPNDLLHILLLVIGIYMLLDNLTPLLTAVINSFKEKMPGGVLGVFEDSRPVAWTSLILNILLPLVLLMFARPISDYFSNHLSNEEIIVEEETVTSEIKQETED